MEKVWIPLIGQRCSRNLVSASGELKAARVSALGGAGVALVVTGGGVVGFLLQAADTQNIRSKSNRSVLFILTRLVSRDSPTWRHWLTYYEFAYWRSTSLSVPRPRFFWNCRYFRGDLPQAILGRRVCLVRLSLAKIARQERLRDFGWPPVTLPSA